MSIIPAIIASSLGHGTPFPFVLVNRHTSENQTGNRPGEFLGSATHQSDHLFTCWFYKIDKQMIMSSSVEKT